MLDPVRSLSTEGGSALDAHVRRALVAAWPANTLRSYRSQARRFVAWCHAAGAGCEPATPDTVMRYLTARAAEGARPATLDAARTAIGVLHRHQGWPNPCATEEVRQVAKGLRAQDGRSQRQAAPLTAEGYAAILATAARPRRHGRGWESEAAARQRGEEDKALAVVLFHGGLRRSEAAALTWGDVEPAHELADAARLHVRRSKTNQDGRRTDVRLVKGAGAKALLGLRPEGAGEESLVFRGMADRTLSRRLAAAARAAGLEGRFSGHSGRVGLASELTARGASLQEVMLAGGWRSAGMVARYAAGAAAEQGAVAKYL